jgi:hypothetical protein
MTNEEYFVDINNTVDEIIVTVSKQSLQPKDGPRRDPRDRTKWDKNSGAVYMTSVRNREVKEHKEGVVTLMPYYRGAEGIVGPTRQGAFSRVSTDDEIREFLKAEALKRDQIQGSVARQRGVAQFTIPPVNEGVK